MWCSNCGKKYTGNTQSYKKHIADCGEDIKETVKAIGEWNISDGSDSYKSKKLDLVKLNIIKKDIDMLYSSICQVKWDMNKIINEIENL
jgi:hypothetical protein